MNRYFMPDKGDSGGGDPPPPPEWLDQDPYADPYADPPPQQFAPPPPPPPPPPPAGGQPKFGYPEGQRGYSDDFESQRYAGQPGSTPDVPAPPKFQAPSTTHGTPSGFPAMFDDSEDFAPGSQPQEGQPAKKVVSMPSAEKHVKMGGAHGADGDPYADAMPPPPPPVGGQAPQGYGAPGAPTGDAPYDPYQVSYQTSGGLDQIPGYGAPKADKDPDYEQSPEFRPNEEPYSEYAMEKDNEPTREQIYEQDMAAQQTGGEAYRAPSVKDLAGGGLSAPPLGGGYGASSDATSMYGAPPPVTTPLPLSPSYGSMGGSTEGATKAGSPYMTGDAAVDRDGVPRYIPDVPAGLEDGGAPGRRIAGVAWLIFAALWIAGNFFAQNLAAGLCVGAPLMLGGALLLTGKRWAGVVGIVGAVLTGLFFMGLAGLLAAGEAAISSAAGLAAIPLPLMVGLGVVGAFFIVTNLMMLVAQPGTGRAVTGAILLVLSQVGFFALSALSASTVKMGEPTGSWEAESQGNTRVGYRFEKPAQWAAFDWQKVQAAGSLGEAGLPVAAGLRTKPDYVYLNRQQTMMAALFRGDVPEGSVLELFGTKSLPEIEKEYTRELPQTGDETTFEYPAGSGIEWTETWHSGTLATGQNLTIVLDKAQVGDLLYYVAVTGDVNAGVDHKAMEDAMNGFFEALRITKK